MAELLKNGSVKMGNGRVLWGRDNIQIIDLCELASLLCPPPPQRAGGFGGFGGGGGGRGPAGTPGAAGAPGAAGPQGPAGSSGGAQGPQGPGGAGPQGPQGSSGVGTQGAQGNQGFQGALNPDLFASTRIVSLIPGDGTDLTIAAAIAALPAEGGYIYIKQGIYPIAAPIVPTNKPIIFLGSGDGTILNLGASVISAFTITFDQRYSFGRMRILGSGVAGQTAFEYAIGGSSVNENTFENVRVDNIEKTFLIAGTDFPIVYTSDCSFNVANLATSFYWDGPGEWHAVNTACAFTGVVPRGGFANNPNLFWVNSDAWLANGAAVGLVQISRCEFLSGTVAGFLTVSAQGSIISDSTFDPAVTAPTRWIDLLVTAGGVVIDGCSFGPPVAETVRIASTNNVLTGNSGLDVLETGVANFNIYNGNDPFFQTSTIIGAGSLVNNEGTASVAVNTLLTGYSRTVEVDASGGARTITLPPAAGVNKIVYTIKKIDASVNTVTIDPDAGELIDGVLTEVLTAQWQAVRIQSNGTGWIII